MNKKSQRQSLIRIAKLWFEQGDTTPEEYRVHVQKINKISDEEVKCKIAALMSAVNTRHIDKKSYFFDEKKVLKEFDSLGENKDDYTPVHTTTVKHEMKKEYSYNAKIKAIAGKLNSSKNPELKRISDTLGSLWGWSSKNVDLVFDNLEQFK